MKQKRTIYLGGTGFQPVVSGILPETHGVAPAVRVVRFENVHFGFAGKIRQDAGFDRPEGCSTVFFE